MKPPSVFAWLVGIVSGLLVIVSLVTGEVQNRAADHRTNAALAQIQAERAARHEQSCEGLPFLTFKNTATLRQYESKIQCPLVGSVPHGGGQPVLPTPTTTAKPSPTATAPATAIPVPGPTTYATVTKTITVQTTKTATVTVTKTTQPQPRVTVTKTCLPAGLLC